MQYFELTSITNLVEKHLQLWGETDGNKRIRLAKEIYHEDIQVTDPGEILNGYEEVSNFIGKLLSNSPGFQFSIAKPIENHHNTAVLSWQFGPSDEPGKICGLDIFTIQKGKVSSLLIFVDGVTASTTNS
ncbi:nuclear transport factor 2 family protein [Mucilaginibacter aquariorum]|uniref:Nuclear transport factor 2 family protein n=1 Tax=Mucilaginibacter aquariorum TaxID=2967225 RepID=A0ABT1SXG8_9SPHI|nr:nuclear transport factor 2 family protein [Mucilaginibacter aquariorum]MCQ6957046.1 nuclear transport factor 2 family protein [Mucilaginibacter aquariorum]